MSDQQDKSDQIPLPPGSLIEFGNSEEMPTLRDQFAMAALTGVCANPHAMTTSGIIHEGTFKACFEIADRMLIEREKTGSSRDFKSGESGCT